MPKKTEINKTKKTAKPKPRAKIESELERATDKLARADVRIAKLRKELAELGEELDIADARVITLEHDVHVALSESDPPLIRVREGSRIKSSLITAAIPGAIAALIILLLGIYGLSVWLQ